MKIFITGSSGFVGGHLSKRLLDDGHQIFALVRNRKKWDALNLEATVIEGDLSFTKSNQWIDKLPKDLDATIHIAGLVHTLNDQDFYDVNEKATRVLIDDLKVKYQKLNFILISSLAASGPTTIEGPAKESDPTNPVSHYGRSKLGAEAALINESSALWNRIIIRPPIVLGPNDPAFLDVFKMVEGRVALIAGLGGKEKMYSFVSVFDLVNVITKALSFEVKTNKVEIFNASFTTPVSYKEILEEIKEILEIEKIY